MNFRNSCIREFQNCCISDTWGNIFFILPFCGEWSMSFSASPHFDLTSFVKPLAGKHMRNGEHMVGSDS